MPLIEEFFNKSRFLVTKLSDQTEFVPDQAFTLSAFILDHLGYKSPTTVTAELISVNGRVITELTAVVTVTSVTTNYYTFTATPASTEWNGTTGLQMRVTIDSTSTAIVPLVIKA